jgi:ABC-type molybdenum transport system ATPase subunit/photorepair protein PhrA
MMGMVINLVLLHQASTKYNIAYLDEIDAGLDHKNRFEFINALYRSIPLLEIDQLFMISHSMEADTSSVDIIKLQGYEDFEYTVQMGNIIFDINNCTN